MSDVRFTEESISNPIPKVRSITLADYLVRWGIVARARDAELMLGLLVVVLIFSAFLVIRSAVPDDVTLGEDILAPGEVVPEYVKQR